MTQPVPFVSSWTLEDGLACVRALECQLSAALGVHFALAGGVMLRGESEHDLDVVVYPRCSRAGVDTQLLRFALRGLGWSIRVRAVDTIEQWQKRGSADRKHVDIWATPERKRVDIIVPSVTVL